MARPKGTASTEGGFTVLELMVAFALSLIIMASASVAVAEVERNTHTVMARTADENAAQAAINEITHAVTTALGGTGMLDVGVLAGGAQLWTYDSPNQLSSSTGTSATSALAVGSLTKGVSAADSLQLVYPVITNLTSPVAAGAITTLQVAALPGVIGAAQTVTVTSAGTSQTFTTSASALAGGATAIDLASSSSAATSFPTGSIVIATTVQTFTAGANAGAGSTSVALQTSYTPVINFPAGTTLRDVSSWNFCTEWQIAGSTLKYAEGPTAAGTSSAMTSAAGQQVSGLVSGSFSSFPGLADVTLKVQNLTTSAANGLQQGTNASALEAEADDPNMPVPVSSTNPCP